MEIKSFYKSSYYLFTHTHKHLFSHSNGFLNTMVNLTLAVSDNSVAVRVLTIAVRDLTVAITINNYQ